MSGWLVRIWSIDDPASERYAVVAEDDPKRALFIAHGKIEPGPGLRLTAQNEVSKGSLDLLGLKPGQVRDVEGAVLRSLAR